MIVARRAPPRRRPRAYRIDVHPEGDLRESLAADVRRGLAERPRWLLAKYFYDERGSRLFERITRLPEYYQTRAELEILRREAGGIVRRLGAVEVVELGAGSARKTEALLDAMQDAGTLRRYVPFDVSPETLFATAGRLATAYPGLRVHGVAGDFQHHLRAIPRPLRSGPRLVAFLGGTIGNVLPDRQAAFLASLLPLMRPEDRLLLGLDLVKDPGVLEAAYNDSAGVTAEFNLNVLRVLDRELGADFDLRRWRHVAFWDPGPRWIEMRLRSLGDQEVHVPGAGIAVRFADGEEMQTEISCKFTEDSAAAMLRAGGLEVAEWHTDARDRFAVTVAAPR